MGWNRWRALCAWFAPPWPRPEGVAAAGLKLAKNIVKVADSAAAPGVSGGCLSCLLWRTQANHFQHACDGGEPVLGGKAPGPERGGVESVAGGDPARGRGRLLQRLRLVRGQERQLHHVGGRWPGVAVCASCRTMPRHAAPPPPSPPRPRPAAPCGGTVLGDRRGAHTIAAAADG